MTHCAMCHRPMKHPRESGLGPVCEKKAPPLPVVERDLFGYDIERAAQVANLLIYELVQWRAAEAHAAVRAQFKEARMALGVRT